MSALAVGRTHLLVNNPKFPAPFKQALAECGILVVEERTSPDAELLRRALAAVADFGGSVKHPLRSLLWRRRLSRFGVPVFSWNRDAPHNNNLPAWRLGLFDRLRPLDIYATHSLSETRWDFADTVLFLPNAVDPSAYGLGSDPESALARLRDPGAYRWDVSFFGALDGERYKEAVARQSFFGELAARLEAQGIRHRFVDTSRQALSLPEQIDLIQSSRINLNFGARCDFGARTAGGLPERCYGIPASGGFLLTDRRTHTADDFVVGRQLDEFSDIDECMAKIREYLADFSRLRSVAEAGWRHVMHHHTYANRARTLLCALGDWHAGRRGLIRENGAFPGGDT